jgi:hypothetical protein
MRYPRGSELPPTQDQANRKAIRLEWVSLVYWFTAIVAIYFTLGQSQAMKAAWVEDILALFPPIAFLVASRFRHREPNDRFPWATTARSRSPTWSPPWRCSASGCSS